MHNIYIICVLAILQFVIFAVFVGQARIKYGVNAPAVSGNEHFERALRVQMNTLEQIVCFIPAILIAAVYWPETYVAAVGSVYLLGRIIYWRSYVSDPKKRALGFMLTLIPTVLLLVAALVGAIMALFS